jgi:hypothetical protein
MHMRFSFSIAARLRIGTGLAALVLLAGGCATPPPADSIPGGPAAVTHSVSPSVSALPDAATPATTALPVRSDPSATPPAAAPAAPATTANGAGGGVCGSDEYRNVDGNCIPRPTQADAAPPGATAECKDGTYSFSQHRSGTCSHHGGVKRWL